MNRVPFPEIPVSGVAHTVSHVTTRLSPRPQCLVPKLAPSTSVGAKSLEHLLAAGRVLDWTPSTHAIFSSFLKAKKVRGGRSIGRTALPKGFPAISPEPALVKSTLTKMAELRRSGPTRRRVTWPTSEKITRLYSARARWLVKRVGPYRAMVPLRLNVAGAARVRLTLLR